MSPKGAPTLEFKRRNLKTTGSKGKTRRQFISIIFHQHCFLICSEKLGHYIVLGLGTLSDRDLTSAVTLFVLCILNNTVTLMNSSRQDNELH